MLIINKSAALLEILYRTSDYFSIQFVNFVIECLFTCGFLSLILWVGGWHCGGAMLTGRTFFSAMIISISDLCTFKETWGRQGMLPKVTRTTSQWSDIDHDNGS